MITAIHNFWPQPFLISCELSLQKKNYFSFFQTFINFHIHLLPLLLQNILRFSIYCQFNSVRYTIPVYYFWFLILASFVFSYNKQGSNSFHHGNNCIHKLLSHPYVRCYSLVETESRATIYNSTRIVLGT